MNTIELTGSATRAPQLIIANGGDKVNGTDRPLRLLSLSGILIRARPGHSRFRTEHFTVVCRTRSRSYWRGCAVYSPQNGRPSKPGLSVTSRQHSRVRDERNEPVFNVTAARLGRSRKEAVSGELAAGWLPSTEFAREWLAFVRRREPLAIWNP